MSVDKLKNQNLKSNLNKNKKINIKAHGYLLRRNGVPNWYWMYYNIDTGLMARRSTGTDNLEEAKVIANQWAVEYCVARSAVKRNVLTNKITLIHACGEYLKHECLDLAPKYIRWKSNTINNRIIEFWGSEFPISDIDSPQVEKFKSWLRQDMGNVSVNKILSTLSKILKYATREGWIPAVPFIQRCSEPQVEHGYVLDESERERLIETARRLSGQIKFLQMIEGKEKVITFDSPPYKNCLHVVALGMYCGLRRSEVVRVRWDDIDWEHGLIRLRSQKNKTLMPAPLGLARDILEQTPVSDRTGFVVGYGRDNRPVKEFRKTWDTLLRESGLDNVVKPDGSRLGFHDLRHTFSQCAFDKYEFDARDLTRHGSNAALMKYLHSKRKRGMDRAKDIF